MTNIYAASDLPPAPPPPPLPILATLRDAWQMLGTHLGEILFAVLPVVLVGAALGFNALKMVLEGLNAQPLLLPFFPIWVLVLILGALALLATANSTGEIYRIALRRKIEAPGTRSWGARIGWTVLWLLGFPLAASVLAGIPALALQAVLGKPAWVALVWPLLFGLVLLGLMARYGAIFPALALGLEAGVADAAEWADGNGWRMLVLYLIPGVASVVLALLGQVVSGAIIAADRSGLSGPVSLLLFQQALAALPLLLAVLINAAAFARLHPARTGQ